MSAGSSPTDVAWPDYDLSWKVPPLAILVAESAAGLAWFLWAAWSESNVGSDLLLAYSVTGLGLLLGVWWLFRRAITVVRIIRKHAVAWSWYSAGALVLPILTVLWASGGPGRVAFEARFWLSESALTRFAQSMEPGSPHSGPEKRVGLYKIKEVDTVDDCVRMITGADFLDDAGFVYCDHEPRRVAEDSYAHFRGKWWLWYRSW